jgi:pimeloyl-ACP methyl ester carboxylesterase
MAVFDRTPGGFRMDSSARRPRRALRWLLVLSCLVVMLPFIAYVGIALYTAHVLTRSNNRPPVLDPHAVGANPQRWVVRTTDGLRLRGWYYHGGSRRQLVVLVHGMQGSWAEMAGLGRDLVRRGYHVLLFDLRGHGQSDPSRLFMGRRERGDIRAVLRWAKTHGFAPERVGWVGHSMGASTVLMEAAQNPEIRVAVLDSPYGNLPELLDRELTDHSHLPRIFNPGILFAARWVFGVRTDDLVPIRFARRWGNRPMLLIHGEADSIVPVRHARLLARAAGPHCAAVTLPGVEHVEAYRRHRRGYVAAVDQFLVENLAR